MNRAYLAAASLQNVALFAGGDNQTSCTDAVDIWNARVGLPPRSVPLAAILRGLQRQARSSSQEAGCSMCRRGLPLQS
jgi:hypothetical protein